MKFEVEVYYIVQDLGYKKKIVAGPYYDRLEAYEVAVKLKKSSYLEFEVMIHTIDLE